MNYKLSQRRKCICTVTLPATGVCLARFSQQFHYHRSLGSVVIRSTRAQSLPASPAASPPVLSSPHLLPLPLRANKSSAPAEGDKTHRRVPPVCSRRDRSRPISHCDSTPATTTLQTNRERARRVKVAKSPLPFLSVQTTSYPRTPRNPPP